MTYSDCGARYKWLYLLTYLLTYMFPHYTGFVKVICRANKHYGIHAFFKAHKINLALCEVAVVVWPLLHH